MRLCTECHWDGWDRIVDIYAERTTTVPDHINADDRFKLVIVEKGAMHIDCGKEKIDVKSPSIILLSHKDKIKVKILKPVKLQILYFDPSVIREEFTYDRIRAGEFEECVGQVIYQDYVLITPFVWFKDLKDRTIEVSLNAMEKIRGLFTSAECELAGQKDGFWPCRSRSYLMELLYFIVYTHIHIEPEEDVSRDALERKEFNAICEYLNEHIADKITVSTITSEFLMNRNKLNDLFMENASMTCMDYLLNLRIDLARIFLTKTEIPIGEVSARVGFSDPDYFTKVFKKKTGVTPTKFRYP
ncbi:MAG: helix-turn-helix transcriptional regulator [Clostridiales bacterium]|nr:helix-turn-helix transcriptional regulator [Clostridiales bacterium]